MCAFIITQEYDKKQNILFSGEAVEYNNMRIPAFTMWDTGAQQTCISTQVAENLKLKRRKATVEVVTSVACGRNEIYDVDIVLYGESLNNSHDELILPLEVIVVDSLDGGNGIIDLVIGMDVISKGDFAVSNFDDKTTFTFRYPSIEKIDFRE